MEGRVLETRPSCCGRACNPRAGVLILCRGSGPLLEASRKLGCYLVSSAALRAGPLEGDVLAELAVPFPPESKTLRPARC
jgi:hypothetical protein